jgi:hypothetical protein
MLWEIWRAIYTSKYAVDFISLAEKVSRWQGDEPEAATQSQAIKDLRKFWRGQGREDFAEAILIKSESVEFSRSS